VGLAVAQEVPDHPHQLRLRVGEGGPGQGASTGGRAVRHQPRGEPAVHADLLRTVGHGTILA
jgi:hypothetical protein